MYKYLHIRHLVIELTMGSFFKSLVFFPDIENYI